MQFHIEFKKYYSCSSNGKPSGSLKKVNFPFVYSSIRTGSVSIPLLFNQLMASSKSSTYKHKCLNPTASGCVGRFEGLGKEIPVGRYHSWVVSREGFPDCLEITAESQEGQIMAIRHKTYNVHGIQFHPESVLTPQGKEIIKNFLND